MNVSAIQKLRMPKLRIKKLHIEKLHIEKLRSAETSSFAKRFILISFPFLVPAVFELYSPHFLTPIVGGSVLTNLLTVSFFGVMMFALSPTQRLMAFIFVPFSFVGEYVFSILFDLYSYRLGHIPIYVPFGHAILFSMGCLVSETKLIRQYEERLRPIFIGLYATLFGLVVLLFHDTLSAIFGLVFLWVLRRKGYRTLYFVMGLLVLYIELTGTAWGCWVWKPYPVEAFAWLHTTNPPFGAFVCYVLADLGVIKIARAVSNRFPMATVTDNSAEAAAVYSEAIESSAEAAEAAEAVAVDAVSVSAV